MSNIIPDINDLHKEKERKRKAKDNLYNAMLKKCIDQIKFINSTTDYTFTYFQIPSKYEMIAISRYDPQQCMLFLISELSKHNYLVEYEPPTKNNYGQLYIDWGNLQSRIKSKQEALKKKYPNVEFN